VALGGWWVDCPVHLYATENEGTVMSDKEQDEEITAEAHPEFMVTHSSGA